MSGTTHAKKLVTTVTGRQIDELLRELYVDQRRTQHEIAEALGVSRDTIVRWLAEYSISREDRDPLPPLVNVA